MSHPDCPPLVAVKTGVMVLIFDVARGEEDIGVTQEQLRPCSGAGAPDELINGHRPNRYMLLYRPQVGRSLSPSSRTAHISTPSTRMWYVNFFSFASHARFVIFNA